MVYPFTNPTDKNSNDNMNYNMGAKTVILVLVVIAISAVTFFVIRGGESSSEDLLITQTPIGSDKPTSCWKVVKPRSHGQLREYIYWVDQDGNDTQVSAPFNVTKVNDSNWTKAAARMGVDLNTCN